MAATSWYRLGTVSLTQNSATVTGAGTGWVAGGIQLGDEFTVDNQTVYEVTAINSDSSITLDRLYAGSSASGAPYAIRRNFSPLAATLLATVTALNASVQTLISDLSISGTGVIQVPQVKELAVGQSPLVGNVVFDFSKFTVITGTVTAGATLTITGQNATGGYTNRGLLIITNGGQAASISYGNTGQVWRWEGGEAPTLSDTGTDIISVITTDGVTYYGTLVGRGFA